MQNCENSQVKSSLIRRGIYTDTTTVIIPKRVIKKANNSSQYGMFPNVNRNKDEFAPPNKIFNNETGKSPIIMMLFLINRK